MTDRWIVIPNWDGSDGFQHYRDRDPIFIKNYRQLLAKDEYLTLSFHCRGILHSLWLEYAASNRQIRDSTLTLTRRLGQRVTTRDLESLNHAGFIEFSASAPLAPCYPRERSKSKRKDLSTSTFVSQVASDPKGREHRAYDPPADPLAHVRRLIGRTIHDEVDLDVELRALGLNLGEREHASLVAALPQPVVA